VTPPVVLITRHNRDTTASLCRVKGQDAAQLHIIDSTVPLSYHGSMLESWPENEVREVTREWQDHDGHTWFVVFELANLRGRIECVGVGVHSMSPLSKLDDPLSPSYDWRASLRPLNATTMRQLPFDDVLIRARRDHAGLMRAGWVHSENDEETQAWGEALAASYEPSGKTGRRGSKYSASFLARVASVYQAAFEDRMDPPAKRVEQELGLTPDVARKLVHLCRDPRLRLLPPAEGRKARGWRPGERDNEGPSR